MKKLYVLFTMDCEAIAELAAEGGPPDWEFARRAEIGYTETLARLGFRPTLFAVPHNAERQSAALLTCERAGAELGLHYHPQDDGYTDYLGAYDAEVQRRMLGEAADRWSQALGRSPESFRGGNMSANDHTFPALASLGFRRGSVSMPERNFTRVKANWKGAPLFAHRTHAANRLLEGDMDFLEAPVTVDWESVMWGGLTPLELRIEMVDARAHGFTIRKSVARQLAEGRSCPALVVLTHNIFDYADPADFRSGVLAGVAREIAACAASHGLEVCGPTLKEFHRVYDTADDGGAGDEGH